MRLYISTYQVSGEHIELLPGAFCIVGVLITAQPVREEAGVEEQVLRVAGQSVSDFPSQIGFHDSIQELRVFDTIIERCLDEFADVIFVACGSDSD